MPEALEDEAVVESAVPFRADEYSFISTLGVMMHEPCGVLVWNQAAHNEWHERFDIEIE